MKLGSPKFSAVKSFNFVNMTFNFVIQMKNNIFIIKINITCKRMASQSTEQAFLSGPGVWIMADLKQRLKFGLTHSETYEII